MEREDPWSGSVRTRSGRNEQQEKGERNHPSKIQYVYKKTQRFEKHCTRSGTSINHSLH